MGSAHKVSKNRWYQHVHCAAPMFNSKPINRKRQMSHKHAFSTRATHERLEKLSKVKLLPQILLTYNWLKLDDARLLMYYCMIVAFKSIIQILTQCF